MKRAGHHRRRKAASAGSWLLGVLTLMTRQARADVAVIPKWPESAVHRLRKRMKKLRSLIQLASPALQAPEREALQQRIRVIKDAVADWRDADVLSALSRDLGATPTRRRPKRPDVRQLTGLVKDLASSIGQQDLSALTWEDVVHCYLKTGKRTRRAWKEAEQHPTEETLHDWRKRVKHHYHQSLALHRWLGRKQDRRLHRIRSLGSLLGRCHDLDVFAISVESKRVSRTNRKVLREIARRRKKLTRRTFRRAAKLFPHSFPGLKHLEKTTPVVGESA